MYRRRFLQGLAAFPTLSAVPMTAQSARAETTTPAAWRRVRPSDAAWPSEARWQALNESVQGRLVAVPPLFAACATDASAGACRELMSDIHNPFFLGDQPAGTQVSGWFGAWTPAASVYAVKAGSANDVAAAVNFARENHLRLVVKGTGHSYQGTSNAPDSLLVWTRAMNKVQVLDHFVPAGCEGIAAPVPAVSAEAGAVWIDLYHAVTSVAGRYVQGGGCTDVGVAGLIQSGGFGSMSKGFGTAASSLLEAEIVTADGRVRTVNRCNDPELFWALQGGGGGSWGVITKVVLRTHELPQHFGGAGGQIVARSDRAFRDLIARFIDFYAAQLFNPHWGEQAAFKPTNVLDLSMACHGLDDRQAAAVWRPFFDWVHASPQDYEVAGHLGAGAGEARHYWDVQGNSSMTPDLRPGAPDHHGWWRGDQDQVGAYLTGYDSLWLPAALLRKDQQHRLVEAIYESSRHKKVSLHFNKGLAGAPPWAIEASRSTATHPAACEAFALAIIADGMAPAYPGLPNADVDHGAAKQDALSIDRATAALAQAAPGAGSYVSESNFFNSDWARAFWGENYPRLQAVKAKYDPDGLFFVHHGVGSEAWSADGFTRIT